MRKNLNVEPFNDFYFSDCFYNSLFASMLHFNRSILPVIINSIPMYSFNINREKMLKLNYTNLDIKKLLKNQNLKLQTINELNLSDFIKNSINNNAPVIINIDWYYIPYQRETYNKQHWYHTILIHGYNDNIKKYKVLDQKYANTLTYTNFDLNYYDLNLAYTEYIKGKNHSSENDVFSVIANKTLPMIEKNDGKTYYNNIIANKYFEITLNCLNKLIDDLDMLIDKWNMGVSESKLFINSLNDIINHKRVESYIIKSLKYNENDLVELIKENEHKYARIRNLLFKTYLSNNKVSKKIENSINDDLIDIYNNELNINEKMKRVFL